jgi:UDP-N-acetylmuramate dehydrogenase
MTPLPSRWRSDLPLRELTTWRIGGPVAYLSQPADLTELREDLALARQRGLRIFALGGGSNLLAADAGYPGLMIRLPGGPPLFLDRHGGARVRVPAGSPLAATARGLAEIGWAGLEWAAGIPGTVGGAVVNNAGAFGGSISEVLLRARLLEPTGRIVTWDVDRFAFAYRSSSLKGADPTLLLLLDVDLQLRSGDSAELQRTIEAQRATRRARTPVGASCGSVFRNPPGKIAGRLIADCGLVGERRGDAEISREHANYILNRGAARAADVIELMRLCRRRLREATGVVLEPEVQLVGFPPDFVL